MGIQNVLSWDPGSFFWTVPSWPGIIVLCHRSMNEAGQWIWSSRNQWTHSNWLHLGDVECWMDPQGPGQHEPHRCRVDDLLALSANFLDCTYKVLGRQPYPPAHLVDLVWLAAFEAGQMSRKPPSPVQGIVEAGTNKWTGTGKGSVKIVVCPLDVSRPVTRSTEMWDQRWWGICRDCRRPVEASNGMAYAGRRWNSCWHKLLGIFLQGGPPELLQQGLPGMLDIIVGREPGAVSLLEDVGSQGLRNKQTLRGAGGRTWLVLQGSFNCWFDPFLSNWDYI